MCEEVENHEQCPQCHRQWFVGHTDPRICGLFRHKYGDKWQGRLWHVRKCESFNLRQIVLILLVPCARCTPVKSEHKQE